ncbi:MAG TPA: hypothetical protein VI451_02270 [Anaerolineales bacterium]|nr:hypothetical protein [Anaerolineales bacterium]
MAFEQHQEKTYTQSTENVYQAALKVVDKLEGSTLSNSPENFHLEVKFNKTILGNVLGERTHLTCEVRPQGAESLVVIDAYPLDAVGRKLMFGARKGVTATVVSWFLAHLENNLGK